MVWKRKKISTQKLTQNYDNESNKGDIVEVDYPKHLQKKHIDIAFFPKRIDISKCLIVVCTIFDKKLRRLHEKFKVEFGLWFAVRRIEFVQEVWLNSYIYMKTELIKKAKNHLWKDFFKLVNNYVFAKNMENMKNHSDIKVVTTEKKLLANEMNTTNIKMNKPGRHSIITLS